jgi:hypothetical protein
MQRVVITCAFLHETRHAQQTCKLLGNLGEADESFAKNRPTSPADPVSTFAVEVQPPSMWENDGHAFVKGALIFEMKRQSRVGAGSGRWPVIPQKGSNAGHIRTSVFCFLDYLFDIMELFI